jgi:protoheme IX farnesyltransferase
MITVGQAKTERRELRAIVGAYVLLMKPWIVALLVMTTLCAMFIAARGVPPLSLIVITLLGSICAAGGANAFNSWYDRDVDKLMERTARRPIPAGRISARHALAFALTLCGLSVAIFGVWVNGLSALLALTGIFYYGWFYTMVLKRTTPQNIVVGGGAGAIPPLVGYVAVTGELDLLAVYLFAIIFLWTPPHTWALMLLVEKDYFRAAIPMMPVAWGAAEARKQSLLYALLLFFFTIMPVAFSSLGLFYLIAAALLSGWFVYLCVLLIRCADKATARRLYKYSNYYLALLFLAMVIDAAVI